jgi:peptidoglycan-N-acetylglucosamine deacetylase
MFYLVKTPRWLQLFFPNYTWKKDTAAKKIFLTFDDGPHPVHTIFVLDELRKINAKATFFCIGKNVELYPEVYNKIIAEGHAVANHTQNHVKGRSTNNTSYLDNVLLAANSIKSNLFRPPYGSIKKSQAALLISHKPAFEIVMWTVLSADFDQNITKEKCLRNVMENTTNGSIVLFHDSEKAQERMCYALPKFLKKFNVEGFTFEAM